MSFLTIGTALLEQLKKSEILIVLASLAFVIATFSYSEPKLEKVFTYSVYASIFFIISFILSIIASSYLNYIKNLPEGVSQRDNAFHSKYLLWLQYFLFSTMFIGLLNLVFIMFEFVNLNENTIKIQYLFSLIFVSIYPIGIFFAIKNKIWLSESIENRMRKPMLIFMIWITGLLLIASTNNLIDLYLDFRPIPAPILSFLFFDVTPLVLLMCAIINIRDLSKNSERNVFDNLGLIVSILGIPILLYLLLS